MYDPLHQFEIHSLFPFFLGKYDLSFTNASLFMVLATLGVCVVFSIGKKKLVPGYLQLIQEQTFGFVRELVINTAGKEAARFVPAVFSLFLFVLAGNYIGLLPYTFTFTSQLVVTFTLAMLIFIVTTIVGIVRHGSGFFRLFFPKGLPIFLAPILIPIEIISYLSRPISLSIRLFANMVAGHMMLKIFAGFTMILAGTSFAPISILPIITNTLIVFFECLIAFLQAYVFTMLTCIYLNDTLNLH